MKKRNVKTRAVALLALLLAGILSSQSLFAHGGRGAQAVYDKPEGISFSDYTLTDGVYRGEAVGFQPGLIVEVTIKAGKVSSIEVVQHKEIGPQYFTRPIRFIPAEILEQQNTEVDAVSGATA
ncbi:MAG: FMN-binding protein, partial [Spirochaetes bacterium]|nr:FMN-binding protein [Spirochaetota bacterium]